MIKPHGGDILKPLFVEDSEERNRLIEESASLPDLLLNSAAAANAVMLGAGYFSPLDGYMNLADTLSVAENMKTNNGLFWPVPCVNRTDDISRIEGSSVIALRDPNVTGNPVLAIQNIEAIETLDVEKINHITKQIFGTLDIDHPGVKTFKNSGKYLISGPIRVLNYSYFKSEFSDTFRTAMEIRNQIQKNNWKTVVAFQTRNPMHRAHEELCKIAKDSVNADGILIHMLLGKLKPGDIPADIRNAAIRKMVELYFPKNTVMVTGYGFDMLYAGPREAVLHAVFRQNAGCTHLIVGRDHAGVGDYYGPFEAQTIFDSNDVLDALDIEIFKADHTAYSKKLNKVVMFRDVPDHTKEDFVMLSGTRVREILSAGKDLPVEFARPEVAKILMSYYQQEGSQ
ncbi:MAG: sulfate adenylyltransferase [Legionellales bacterium]|nr:sulfate adenylyltransferase [Legionellales bacterium]|tara:strand:- start:3528 stop:4721 length:1194 start_codon:yes stop_codon:yes gene_type:complete